MTKVEFRCHLCGQYLPASMSESGRYICRPCHEGR